MSENNSIGFEIKVISNLLKRKIFEFVPPPGEEEFTDMQGQIIDFLYVRRDKEETFQKDVEEKFSIRRSTASRILRALEEKGVILRESVPHDARLKKLVLTSKAIKNHENIREKIEELEALISKGLTEEECRIFFDITKKIKKNIEKSCP